MRRRIGGDIEYYFVRNNPCAEHCNGSVAASQDIWQGAGTDYALLVINYVENVPMIERRCNGYPPRVISVTVTAVLTKRVLG